LLRFTVLKNGEVVALEPVNRLARFVGDDYIEQHDASGGLNGGCGINPGSGLREDAIDGARE
jgi:hypothetical protein